MTKYAGTLLVLYVTLLLWSSHSKGNQLGKHALCIAALWLLPVVRITPAAAAVSLCMIQSSTASGIVEVVVRSGDLSRAPIKGTSDRTARASHTRMHGAACCCCCCCWAAGCCFVASWG